jgi:transposase
MGVITVELLSVIRRWHLRDQMSIREIAKRTGLSRNTIKKYLRNEIVTPQYHGQARITKLSPYTDKLKQWLKTESNRGRKERRSVKSLYGDLVKLGYLGSYDRVVAYAKHWRLQQQQLAGTIGRGAFIPLTFAPGEAFQFDWSEDWAVIGNERTKLQVAHFKLAHSRAFYLRAYPLQTHEMLFDAHHHAFQCLGGVPKRGIYDNMRTAVDKVGRGKQRTVNARFKAMTSHYLFEAEFCNPASGWEKGQVEKNVQDARHRLWHQAPSFTSLEALNRWLSEQCIALWQQIIHPEYRQQTIADVWQLEQPTLMPTPQAFDGFVEYTKRVTPTCLVNFERNRYSVPSSFANRHVNLRVYADHLVMVAEGVVIAKHQRTINRHHRASVTCYEWQHYLSVLQRKPGALRNGAPFTVLPEAFKQLQTKLLARAGGDREMVEVLSLVLHYDETLVLAAIEASLVLGVASKPNILNILRRMISPELPPLADTPQSLSLNEEPSANVERYDGLRVVRHAA